MKVIVLKPIFGESAVKVVTIASKYSETILIKRDKWVVDAKSLLGLLASSLRPEQEIEITSPSSQYIKTEIIKDFLDSGLFSTK